MLSGINIEVNKGGLLFVVGHVGSGKVYTYILDNSL